MHFFNDCAITGIFTRYGFWLNLDTLVWTKLGAPTFNPIADVTNAMYSFRGSPTIFGFPNCNAEGFCPSDGVLQYDQDNDRWELLGSIDVQRRMHTVVEVPGEWCDLVRII